MALEHGQTVVSFLPVILSTNLIGDCSTVEYWYSMYLFSGTDDVHVENTWWHSSQVNAVQSKMTLLHDAMMEIVRPLVHAGFASFEVDGELRDDWNCFPVDMSYCCKNVEPNDMSCLMHSIAVVRVFVRCMDTTEDIVDLRKSDNRQLRKTTFAREKRSIHDKC